MFDPKVIEARLAALEAAAGTAVKEGEQSVVERLEALENFIAEKVLPLLPLLQEKNAGQVAGTGAAQTEGVVIPATELGEYRDPPQPAAESEQPSETKPAA